MLDGFVAAAGIMLRQGRLQPVAQAIERTAQIVGDVVGDGADAAEQTLDLVEHAVEIFRQTVELVMAAAHGHAMLHAAMHDALGPLVDGVDAAEDGAAHDQAFDHAEQHDDRQGRDEGAGQRFLEALLRTHVAADQEMILARQQRDVQGLRAVRFGIAEFAAIDAEGHPGAVGFGDRRPALGIAGDRLEIGRGQDVDAVAGEARPRALHERVADALQAVLLIDAAQAFDIGADRRAAARAWQARPSSSRRRRRCR